MGQQVYFAQVLRGEKQDRQIQQQHYMHARQEHGVRESSLSGFASALHSETTYHDSIRGCKGITLSV